MWKTAKQAWWALGQWWAVFLAGPDRYRVQMETTLEHSVRRVFQTHERRFGFIGQEPVKVRLMDAHEKQVEEELEIAATLRRPKLQYKGIAYAASHQDGAVWVYRRQL